MNSSPPIKHKKKRAKGPKAAEGQDLPEPAEAPAEKVSKQPGKAKIKSSENALTEARCHVQKLWGALDTLKVSKAKGDLGSVPKFQY